MVLGETDKDNDGLFCQEAFKEYQQCSHMCAQDSHKMENSLLLWASVRWRSQAKLTAKQLYLHRLAGKALNSVGLLNKCM